MQESNQRKGLPCKSNVRAGNVLQNIQNQVTDSFNTDAIVDQLQKYATFPFSMMNDGDCDCNCDTQTL